MLFVDATHEDLTLSVGIVEFRKEHMFETSVFHHVGNTGCRHAGPIAHTAMLDSRIELKQGDIVSMCVINLRFHNHRTCTHPTRDVKTQQRVSQMVNETKVE